MLHISLRTGIRRGRIRIEYSNRIVYRIGAGKHNYSIDARLTFKLPSIYFRRKFESIYEDLFKKGHRHTDSIYARVSN